MTINQTMHLLEIFHTASFTLKDLLIILTFFGSLITVYINNRKTFIQFKTEIEVKQKLLEDRIALMEKQVDKQKEVEQELLLDGRETRTILMSIAKSIDELKERITKAEQRK